MPRDEPLGVRSQCGPIRCFGPATGPAPSGFLWRKGGKGLHGVRLCDRVGSHKEDTTVVVVSYSGKEINAKLVYYGCGLCGKTTNLESIYEAVPDTSRGKMVSMKTQSDRTLFFDLLPLDLGEIMGFKTRFLLYTVPGQVFYNATRKLVLKGADAIVFVADSEVGKMEENKESLENLRANLAEYKVNLDEIPWVLQYNKRDLPNIYSIEELQAALDPTGQVPHFEAVAMHGKGVFETFRGISHLLMEKVTKELRRGSVGGPAAPARPQPAAEPATRAESVAASAPPTAPARTIAREAQVSRAAEEIAAPAGSAAPDYGREIELPNQIPPAEAPVRREPAPEPVAAAVAPSAPAPMASTTATAPTAAPRPEPRRAPEPVAEKTVIEKTVTAPLPQPTARTQNEPATASVVVPVTLPLNGGPAELVIRIVLKHE
jgi:mutual gliding-motility protein MglA